MTCDERDVFIFSIAVVIVAPLILMLVRGVVRGDSAVVQSMADSISFSFRVCECGCLARFLFLCGLSRE